jgi:hypothetical protein
MGAFLMQQIVSDFAASVMNDSGWHNDTVWGIDVEWSKIEGGGYLIKGDPLHVRVVAALAAVEERFNKAYDRLPEADRDDDDVMGRFCDRKWAARRRAVAPLFAALLQKRPRKTKAPAKSRAKVRRAA